VGVFLAYSVGDDGEIAGGPDLATLSGWLQFLNWAEPLSDFPALSQFAAECTCWSAEEIGRLEAELPEALKAHADALSPDLVRTLGRLIDALAERPGGAVGLIATDGTPGDDDDEDDDADDDQDDDQDEDSDEETARPGPAAAAPKADPGEGLEAGMPTPAAGAATPAQLKAAEDKRRLTGEPPPGSWQNDTRELRYERAGYSSDGGGQESAGPDPATPAPKTQPAPEAKAPAEWPPEWGAPEISY
jgi:hypothetical protein